MVVSTKGRYALRALLDLAEHSDGEYIPMKDIVARQGISQKYMERLMTLLSKNGYIDGVHGKGGGYRLNRPLDEYRIGDILRLTEGSLAPITCLECGAEPCGRASECKTIPMWRELDRRINEYLDQVTLKDLLEGNFDY